MVVARRGETKELFNVYRISVQDDETVLGIVVIVALHCDYTS